MAKNTESFSGSVESSSDLLKEMFCEHCKTDKKQTVAADGFCTDCCDYMCGTCLFYHQKYKFTHKVEDKNSMPKDFSLDKCQVHKSKIVKFYCESCNKTGCIDCKKQTFKRCTKVHHLPSFLRLKRTELGHIEENLKTVSNSLIKAETELDEKIMLFHKNQTNVDSAIHRHKEEIAKTVAQERINICSKFDLKENEFLEEHEKERQLVLQELKNRKQKLLQELEAEKQDAIQDFEQRKKAFLEPLNDKKNEEIEQFENVKPIIENEVDTSMKVVTDEYERLHAVQAQKIPLFSDRITAIHRKLQGLLYGLTTQKNTGEMWNIWLQMKNVREELPSIETEVLQVLKDFDVNDVEFHPASVAVVRSMIQARCGELNSDSKDAKQSPTPQINTQKTEAASFLFGTIRSKLNVDHRRADFSHKIGNDFECTGICVVSMARLVVIARSTSLKLFDTKSGKLLHEINHSTKLFHIAYISSDTVAVVSSCVYLGTKVMFVKVTSQDELVISHRIKTNSSCNGFTYLKSYLVLFSVEKTTVCVRKYLLEHVNMTEKILNKFEIFKKVGLYTEQKLCMPKVVSSNDLQTLYISIPTDQTVIQCSLQGEVQNSKTLFFTPHSIALDRRGIVYVCDERSIYRLSRDLKNQDLLVDIQYIRRKIQTAVYGMKRQDIYTDLYYCNLEDKLYVASSSGIYVYKIHAE